MGGSSIHSKLNVPPLKKQLFPAIGKISILFIYVSGLVSLFVAFSNAQDRSQDFQWSPSKLFWDGNNPYSVFLNNDPQDLILYSQNPNYAHLIYVLFLPLTLISFEQAKVAWALLNVFFATSSVWIVGRRLKLSHVEMSLVAAIFLASTAFRTTLGNGQHGLFVLFLIANLLNSDKVYSALISGIAYVKYSFMPIFALWLFFARSFKHFLVSLLPVSLGWLIFSRWIGESPRKTLFQPLEINKETLGIGSADLLSISTYFMDDFGEFSNLFSFFLAFLASALICLVAVRHFSSEISQLAVISIGSLITFIHFSYDFVFLLIPFMYLFCNRSFRASKLGLLVVGYIWFGWKLLDQFYAHSIYFTILNFFLLICLLSILYVIERQLSHSRLEV